ncbi:hypothetical protein KL935_001235 [Ogataea polymorpha]|nr:hypothetical protein KL935_001235 [Ogataea polymorpha]
MLSAKICWFRDYEEPKVMPEGTAKAKMEAAVVELVHIARTKICTRKARNTDKLTREKRSSAYPKLFRFSGTRCMLRPPDWPKQQKIPWFWR